MIKLPVLSLMIVSLLGTQTYALARSTEVSAQNTVQDSASTLNQTTEALENSMNTLSAIARSEDQQAAGEEASSPVAEDFSKRQVRIKKRWMKRLDRSSLKLVERYNKNVDSMNDEQVLAAANRTNHTHLSGSVTEMRDQMKANFLQNLPKLKETIASQIAKAGGMAPFMLHLKKQLKSLKAQMASHQRHTLNRAIASDVSDVILTGLMCLSAAVFLVGFAVGIDLIAYIALGAFAVNLGILAMIDSLED